MWNGYGVCSNLASSGEPPPQAGWWRHLANPFTTTLQRCQKLAQLPHCWAKNSKVAGSNPVMVIHFFRKQTVVSKISYMTRDIYRSLHIHSNDNMQSELVILTRTGHARTRTRTKPTRTRTRLTRTRPWLTRTRMRTRNSLTVTYCKLQLNLQSLSSNNNEHKVKVHNIWL